MQEDQRDNEQRWEQVRTRYPAQEPLLNLNNAAVSPPPRVVEQAAIEAFRLVSRNPDVNMWTRLDANLPSIKDALAALVDCDAAEIALNRNSTEGLSTVIFGVTMQPGDEVVVSEWDYPSALRGWQQRAAREGIRVVTVRFDPLDDDDAIVSAYSNALTPRTRVMQLTHMLHGRGAFLPSACASWRASVGWRPWSTGRRPSRKYPSVFPDARLRLLRHQSPQVAGCSRWKRHVDRAPRPHSIHVAPDGTVRRRAAPHRQIRPLEPWDLQLRAVAGHRSRHRDPSRNQRPCHARSPARVDPLLGGTGSWHSRFQHAHAGRRRAARSGQPVLDCRCRMRHVEQELRDRHRVHAKYRRMGPIEGLRVSPHVYIRKTELQRFVEALDRVLG